MLSLLYVCMRKRCIANSPSVQLKSEKKGKQIYMHTDCDRAKKVNADMPKCTM